MGGIRAELLKYKRTMMKKLIIGIPLIFTMFSIVIRILMPEFKGTWDGILILIFNWWPLLFLSLGMGIFSSLVAIQEKKAGNYYSWKIHSINVKKIWFYKITGMAIYSFYSSCTLIIAILLSGIATSKGTIPIKQILFGSFVCWISSLILIPLQLWSATWKGIFFSMGVAMAGMLVGVLAAPEKIWFLVPWSWSLRILCPIIGVNPNGTTLEPDSLLLDPSVIPIGLLLSVIGFLFTSMITASWFSRRK